ncbi:HD domain-containing protein [Amycolatopsis acidicola]|uniref:HD domain-containing protein n=1 Tax=Amycolatopsis acidicola TaxID=2596893 RepID=A0A5N0V1C3_9PSEU|nr:HD domain-containing protein [Amycolatopsis acidicola]KAA9160257.1 HD domain-containing protein [Amycolatopsis acidicola]
MTLTVTELGELVDGLAGLPYGGEAVDQRTHALQAGWFAAEAEADDELLLAAVLHDVGRAESVRTEYPGLPHELAGAEFARKHLSESAAWIIAQHVPAKRFLVATDAGYGSLLSPASVASLKKQGGPMSTVEAEEFRGHPRWEDAVRVRRWDDAAKDPDGPVLTTEDVLTVYRRWLGGQEHSR